MNDREFSVRSMKNVIGSYTGKRVSRDAALQLSRWLEEFGNVRSEEAEIQARESGRKTVRGIDFKETRQEAPRQTGTDIVNAPVERIIRGAGASRVSESAVTELKKELLYKAEEISEEVDRLAGHADRETINSSDFDLAQRGDL